MQSKHHILPLKINELHGLDRDDMQDIAHSMDSGLPILGEELATAGGLESVSGGP